MLPFLFDDCVFRQPENDCGMLFDLNRYSFNSFLNESSYLVKLALPMMLASIAAVGVGVVDTVMAGGAGKENLTVVALGSALFNTVFITLIGVMTALNPVIAQMHGAGETTKVGEIGRQGLWFGLFIGVFGLILMLGLIAPLKNYLTFSAHLENMLGDFVFYTALAMPAAMLHRALHAYAASLNRPNPIMWVSWGGLVLSIPVNYVLIYGKLGLPEMGGAGCGLTTLIVFIFNAIALAFYIWREPYFDKFALFSQWCLPNKTTQKQFWQIGWPIGGSYFLEASLFTSIVWLLAPLGEENVSAQQVVMSITSVIYMIPQSIGTAATVRIGFSIGKRQFARARYVSGVGLTLGLSLAMCTMLFLSLARFPLVQLYTDDQLIIALASSIILFAAVFQLVDFTQCIASYALRGYKVTRMPMLIHAIAFWLCGLIPGYLLSYHFKMGIYGFWTALVLSLSFAAMALVWYLEKCSKFAMLRGGI